MPARGAHRCSERQFTMKAAMPRHIQHCSVCQSSEHTRPRCPLVYTCHRARATAERYLETAALRDAVWQQLSLRYPLMPHQLFERLRADWGSLGERRLWRALRWNAQRERVAIKTIAVEDGTLVGYVRRAA